MSELAVCLLSGGLDSCVAAAIALTETPEQAFLHVSYGQRTESRERQAFEDISDHYQISRRLVADISYLGRMGGSALTDHTINVPEGELDREGIPVSYVPFRNAHLLAIATSWAETLDAGRIYIGAVEEDSSGYPDCRPAFFRAFEAMIDEGTRPETRIRIETPLIAMTKAEIVRRGLQMEAPLHLTWSCYSNSDRACGRCDSCLLRLRGFRQAGAPDPLPYV